MKKIFSLFIVATLVFAAMALSVNAEIVVANPSELSVGGEINKLSGNMYGYYEYDFANTDLIIDLNGYTWTSDDVVLKIINGNVTVYDSSPNKTGKIESSANDAVTISNGSLYIKDITVVANGGGMDAIFVDGGNVIVENCILSAEKACIDASNASEAGGAPANISVNGGKFANYSAPGDRNCAIELRNSGSAGPRVTLTGNIEFENNKLLMREDYTQDFAWAILAGENATVEFAAVQAHASRTNYKTSAITYAYNGPVAPETEAATEAPATDAATEAPTTDAATEAPTTSAATSAVTSATTTATTTASGEAGDGSILPIILVIVAVVAVAAVAAVVVIKKKK